MITSKAKAHLSVEGQYITSWDDSDGNRCSHKTKNIITDVGLTSLAEMMVGHKLPPNFIELGYSNTAASSGQTDLVTPIPDADLHIDPSGQPYEIPRKFTEQSRLDIDNKNQVLVNFSATYGGFQNFGFGDSTAPIEVKEIAAYDTGYNRVTRGGTMYSRAVLELADQVFISKTVNPKQDWNLKFNRGKSDTNGGVVKNAMDIIAWNLMRKNELEAGLGQNGDRQDQQKYVEFFLNVIEIGRGTDIVKDENTQLDIQIVESDEDIRITSINIIPAADPSPAKIIMQRYVKGGTISDTITEMGLFNFNRSTLPGDQIIRTEMFARCLLDTPIPAGQEAVLIFELTIGR